MDIVFLRKFGRRQFLADGFKSHLRIELCTIALAFRHCGAILPQALKLSKCSKCVRPPLGKWTYFYRAVDRNGQTLDFMLSERRNLPATRRFLRKIIASNGVPERVVIDKSGANLAGLQAVNVILKITDGKIIGFVARFLSDKAEGRAHRVGASRGIRRAPSTNLSVEEGFTRE